MKETSLVDSPIDIHLNSLTLLLFPKRDKKDGESIDTFECRQGHLIHQRGGVGDEDEEKERKVPSDHDHDDHFAMQMLNRL